METLFGLAALGGLGYAAYGTPASIQAERVQFLQTLARHLSTLLLERQRQARILPAPANPLVIIADKPDDDPRSPLAI